MINKTDEHFAVEAVLSINSKSAFSVSETYESLLWHSEDIDKPTKSQFDEALVKVKSDWEAKQYQRDRASAYPSWQTQMDLLYHGGIDALKAELKKTKDKFPKPT